MKENITKGKGTIKFKLKHWEGVTLFKVIEQTGFERGCGEIFKGSNGWGIISKDATEIYESRDRVYIQGLNPIYDNSTASVEDPNKDIYNEVLETFKELGKGETSEPKLGDRVLVRNELVLSWEEMIYVTTLPKKCKLKYIVVADYTEIEFKQGLEYEIESYAYMKPLKQENNFEVLSEDTFEVSFWVKG